MQTGRVFPLQDEPRQTPYPQAFAVGVCTQYRIMELAPCQGAGHVRGPGTRPGADGPLPVSVDGAAAGFVHFGGSVALVDQPTVVLVAVSRVHVQAAQPPALQVG